MSNKAARTGSKMEQALIIFNQIPGDRAKRKQCILRFQNELNMERSTAGTYYNLCEKKVLNTTSEQSQKVIESSRARKFSAVKCRGGVASHVQVFFSKKEAEQFNDIMFGFDHVVKGVQPVGKQIQVA